jgi:hypothetical protein
MQSRVIEETYTDFEGWFQLGIPELEDGYKLIAGCDGYHSKSIRLNFIPDPYLVIELVRACDW